MNQNEKNLDRFADMLEPAAAIITDKEIKAAIDRKELPIKVIRMALKRHRAESIRILALTEGVDPDTYVVPGPIALAVKLMQIANDPDLISLFTSQGQMMPAESSGSAMVNTKDGA